MRDPIAIHCLAADDVPMLEAMSTMFGAAFGEPETYTRAPPSAGYLRRLLGRDHVLALAALDGDAVVGALLSGIFILRSERVEVEGWAAAMRAVAGAV